jgi:hypothetical protein
VLRHPLSVLLVLLAVLPGPLHALAQDAPLVLLTVSGGARAGRNPVTAPALGQEVVAAHAVGLDQTLRPWDPGVMGGRVAVLGVVHGAPETPAPATPLPALSADAVVARAQAAVRQAGTYRFQLTVNGDPEPTERSADDPWGSLTRGDVDIHKGIRRQSPDGSEVEYYDYQAIYSRGPEGTWFAYLPGRGYDEPLLQFLSAQPSWWHGTAVVDGRVDGRAAYILESEFWIDAATFLPLKRTTQSTEPLVETETIFFDFGAPVDVQVPPEAVTSLFMPTLLGGDFASVQWYFAPENQPATWHDIFTRTSEQTAVDVLPCRDVAYDVVARPGAVTGVDSAEVSVVFADPCIQTREGQARVPSDTMLVTLEYREGQWDVQRVAVPH